MLATVKRATAIACGLYLALWLLGGDRYDAIEKPVSIIVRPQIMISRGDIRVEVRVPHDADNRHLVINWDSIGGSVGETQRQLDGDDAPVLHVLELHAQPPAHYHFFAYLYGQRGELRGRADAEIHTPDDGGS